MKFNNIMTFQRFKEIYWILEDQPIFNSIDPDELEEYHKLQDSNQRYYNWLLKQKIKGAGIKVPNQCCLEMQFHLIEYYKEKRQLKGAPDYINYDSVISYNKMHRDYGLPIHDGGSSYVRIKFCPWCGKSLK